jgi:hypothetical protein
MPYTGNKPSAVPLTSADIADSIITSAKIVDGTIVNADINASSAIAVSKLSATGTSLQVLRMNSGATALEFATVTGTVFGSALLHVRDEKATNTSGGTFTSGAWQTRTLNTVKTNEISGASLASNQITLPSGTYYIFASANIGYNVGRHIAKLRNTTDSSDTLIGSSEYVPTGTGTSNKSYVIGRFTIASQKVFELQHQCDNTVGTDGFGVNINFSVTQVFADVQIWKVA